MGFEWKSRHIHVHVCRLSREQSLRHYFVRSYFSLLFYLIICRNPDQWPEITWIMVYQLNVLTNLFPGCFRHFLWCAMVSVISDHRSWSASSWNAPMIFHMLMRHSQLWVDMGPRWPGHYFCQFENSLPQPKIKWTHQLHLEICFNLPSVSFNPRSFTENLFLSKL